MASARTDHFAGALGARCICGANEFAITLLSVTSDGCVAEAEADWAEDYDFLRLELPDGVVANGQVTRRDGRVARIMFFGQIHPVVVAGWQRRTA